MTILVDTREPWPHPWALFWADMVVERATLDTGDLCLACNPGVAVERKTVADLASCMTGERERFERELRRAACCCASFAVVVSGSLEELLMQRRIHPNAIMGTMAAWSRRYRHPILFAGNDRLAAEFALRFLSQPIREAQRLLGATEP